MQVLSVIFIAMRIIGAVGFLQAVMRQFFRQVDLTSRFAALLQVGLSSIISSIGVRVATAET